MKELTPKYVAQKSYNKKAYVEEVNGETKLYSYGTLVAEVNKNGDLKVHIADTQTTLRHLKDFILQYTEVNVRDNNDIRALV